MNYIQGLEEKYDRALEMRFQETQDELPSSDVVIEELEAFFRQNNQGDDGESYGLGDLGLRS